MATDIKSVSILEALTPAEQTPNDFDNYLPWAAAQLEGEFNLVITRAVQDHYVSVVAKDRKWKLKPKTPISDVALKSGKITPDAESDTSETEITKNENTIYIETTYNDSDQLVTLKFNKNKTLPRLLFKIINLIIKYHSALSSLIINQGLNAEVIHEISKYFTTNRITELVLDNCYVPEANYHILLDNDVLKHFSLSKCYITDSVVKMIASKLTRPSPAAKSLSALNLSINKITDIGVKYLAEMLRTNRQLSYLSLAHNRITDEGAKSILDILKKFVLTKEDCLDRNRKLLSYINRKSQLKMQTFQELRSSDFGKKLMKKSTKLLHAKNKPEAESVPNFEPLNAVIANKAETIVKGILGGFNHPFNGEETIIEERALYCLGNNTLRYLNFAYNNLTYISVKKINEVMEFQKVRDRKLGLLNVRIDGNLLPSSCNEYDSIDDLLLNAMTRYKSTLGPFNKRKTVTNLSKKK